MADPGLPDTETEGGRGPSLNDHAKRHVHVSAIKMYNLFYLNTPRRLRKAPRVTGPG